MNRLMLLAGAAAILALGACEREATADAKSDQGGGALRTISRLDCPESQGALKRVSAAPDGLSCAYQADGAEVTLRLVALNGAEAKTVLDPVEAELKGLIPPPALPPLTSAAAPAPSSAATNTVAAAETGQERAEIDFPGLHIKADDRGAQIRIGGIKVDANDNGAEIRVGEGTTVNAGGDGAEIRTANGKVDGVRSTYILASDKAASGYQVAGYEARGPKAGPLVVAVVKAREGKDKDDVFDDMKDLVERNVGE